jgi:hypothetical protein
MVILALVVAIVHPFPVVAMSIVNGDPIELDGVPVMVSVVPDKEEVTPAGSPVTVAPVAPPDKV